MDGIVTQKTDVLVIGAGYTGHRLAQKLRASGKSVVETTRSGRRDTLVFDQSHATDWAKLPDAGTCYWLCAAQPNGLAENLDHHRQRLGKLVVVGSTSSLCADEQHEVYEHSPRQNSPRAIAEETFRRTGACLLLAAGIYGPARNPLDWLASGRVAVSDKWLNLIHVEDLVSLLRVVADKGRPGATYVAADGNPNRWRALAADWQREFGLLLPPDARVSKRESKRVNTSWTLDQLDFKPSIADVRQGVRALMMQD